MKIGAYDLSSQFNSYSKFSATSIKSVDNLSKIDELDNNKVAKKSEAVDSVSIGNKDAVKNFAYSKYSPNGVVLNSDNNVRKLDDFSLVSAKEDVIVSRTKTPEPENINYKEIISDDEMSSFLKDAFSLFKAN